MRRQNFTGLTRFCCVLSLTLIVVMWGWLLKTEAALQQVSFGAKTDFGTGSNPFSVATGDFNGDGKLDLAVVGGACGTDTLSVRLGTGTGSFGAKTDFGTGGYPTSVVVGDFNRDGKLDLAVANQNDSNVSILLGNGD